MGRGGESRERGGEKAEERRKDGMKKERVNVERVREMREGELEGGKEAQA